MIFDAVEFCEWADKTFPHSTPKSIVAHLRREVAELEDSHLGLPEGVRLHRTEEEIADCYLLLLHLCWRLGRLDIDYLAGDKFAVLLKRKWGAIDADGVVEHIRDNDEETE